MSPTNSDTAALARGGRTSFVGFLLRLGARFPFLLIAGRLYGAEALGRFAYAVMAVELMAQLATLGLKRGLAAELADTAQPQAHDVADALLLAWLGALAGALLLIALPVLVYPNGGGTGFGRLFPLIALAIVGSDISLAALAFRHRIKEQVTARSVIEPWVLAGVALALFWTPWRHHGLIIAYAFSLTAAAVASLVPAWREFDWPRGWRPEPARLLRLVRANLPLAGADLCEWASRRIDIVILGRFAGAEVIGVYFIAQQVATVPSKLKNSFDAILAPVITTSLARGDHAAVAAHLRQIGFWVAAAQLGAALALGFTGGASMALFGNAFAGGGMVLAVLLAAEVVAAQAAIAESALIYVRRLTNLLLSLAGLALQVGVSIVLVTRYGALGAAAALVIAALALSLAKAFALGRALGHPVSGWRWSLPAAALPAAAAGLAVQPLHGVLQLVVGIPLITGVFAAAIWTIGFRGPDRLLFQARSG